MGRSYAGILGPLAFVTELARGALRSAGTESTVTTAVAALFAFAAIGFVLGELAGWIVNDSVRSRLALEIAAAKPKAPAANAGGATMAVPSAPNAAAANLNATAKPNAAAKQSVAAKPNVATAAAKPTPQPAKPNAAKPNVATAAARATAGANNS
jgi:hypothetical protein